MNFTLQSLIPTDGISLMESVSHFYHCIIFVASIQKTFSFAKSFPSLQFCVVLYLRIVLVPCLINLCVLSFTFAFISSVCTFSILSLLCGVRTVSKITTKSVSQSVSEV